MYLKFVQYFFYHFSHEQLATFVASFNKIEYLFTHNLYAHFSGTHRILCIKYLTLILSTYLSHL